VFIECMIAKQVKYVFILFMQIRFFFLKIPLNYIRRVKKKSTIFTLREQTKLVYAM